MTIPLLVGRLPSINAVEKAAARDRVLFVTAQKRGDVADPQHQELFETGTIVRVLQLFRLPDGSMRVLVEGLSRAVAKRFQWSNDFYTVTAALYPDEIAVGPEVEALQRNTLQMFQDYVHLNRRIPDEVLATTASIADASQLSLTIASHLQVKVPAKQRLLEAPGTVARLNLLAETLASELEIVRLERKIEGQVRSQVHKNQKEFYLHEQLKAIRKELGQPGGGDSGNEVEELATAIRKAKMPKEVRARAMKELDRLSRMSFMSPEATVVRGYIDWLTALPWRTTTKDDLDIGDVQKVLDEDHFGLEKVKDRITEYLSVLKLTGHNKAPILCFVGPPGVGKTSLGKSIARSIGRRFVRLALGGVRDEAEIRGHRRTYIGSMPGRIIQGLRRAGSRNPVFLLDEIDKLGSDFRGDPASALLEVLDPEQNHTFADHYLEVDFDLSTVLFICTANSLYTIPPALVDRMEVIRLPGYLETEKLQIARRFLLPKQVAAAGLAEGDIHVPDQTLRDLMAGYTREAGVRSLEREIAGLCRKVAKVKAEGKLEKRMTISPQSLGKLIGPRRWLDTNVERGSRVGVANGLAWTETGGDLLTIEVSILPGKGDLLLTGKLGDVMRESGQAAMSYARSRAAQFGLERWFHREIDVHVHVPEGAMPKDGPSAGITMATALVSALTGTPTRADVAMTGEITLRGTVLPIGGLNEKAVAARRAGMKTVLVPRANEKDIAEIPREVREAVEFVLVDDMDQVLDRALQRETAPKETEGPARPATHYAH
ncbi:MAG: endopeptidase La [Candidatus Eisenbacteria bacterium]|uniref:Lon protease n=1 Tax=Eiseniibacteriota bacterium TaxID=2212470 RepID=A0A933SFL6_UNCEI|nr:endopeptidase La [Candidatus Eisenbacteria bacterium]